MKEVYLRGRETEIRVYNRGGVADLEVSWKFWIRNLAPSGMDL